MVFYKLKFGFRVRRLRGGVADAESVASFSPSRHIPPNLRSSDHVVTMIPKIRSWSELGTKQPFFNYDSISRYYEYGVPRSIIIRGFTGKESRVHFAGTVLLNRKLRAKESEASRSLSSLRNSSVKYPVPRLLVAVKKRQGKMEVRGPPQSPPIYGVDTANLFLVL